MPQSLRTLTLADIASLSNAATGIVAVALATTAPGLTARLILLAAIADGLDGILAHKYGSSPIGPYLDSLSDTISFVAAPAILLISLPSLTLSLSAPLTVAVAATAILYSASGIIRLAFYTANDVDNPYTTGAPTTLAATIISAAYLTGDATPTALLGITLLFSYLMLCNMRYPDLLVRDALIMGVLQALAILTPNQFNQLFPFALLFAAISYLLLSPFFYWQTPPEPNVTH